MLNLIKSIFHANQQNPGEKFSNNRSTLNHLIELSGRAVIDEAVFPLKKGRCRWKGSYWFARCELAITLQPEDVVEVVGIDDITLLVKPINYQDYSWGDLHG